MFLRSTSPDTREVNKSKVRFPFWKLYRDRCAVCCVQNGEKNINLLSSFFFFAFKKSFFQGEIFIFRIYHISRVNVTFSLGYSAFFQHY